MKIFTSMIVMLAIGLAGVSASHAAVEYSLEQNGHIISVTPAMTKTAKALLEIDGKKQPLENDKTIKVGRLEVIGQFGGRVLNVRWTKTGEDLNVSFGKTKPKPKKANKSSSPSEKVSKLTLKDASGRKYPYTVTKVRVEKVTSYIYSYSLTGAGYTCEVWQEVGKKKLPKEFTQAVKTIKLWEVK